MTKFITIFFLFLASTSLMTAGEVRGYWQTYDKATKQPSSIIAVYSYQGKYYGRIIATCKQGVITETLERPDSRAPGLPGNPHFCGLDIFWGFAPSKAGMLQGHVIDPRDGNMYDAKLWTENGNLILRGELFVFGRNETLGPYNFNGQFNPPNVATFVPVYCRAK